MSVTTYKFLCHAVWQGELTWRVHNNSPFVLLVLAELACSVVCGSILACYCHWKKHIEWQNREFEF